MKATDELARKAKAASVARVHALAEVHDAYPSSPALEHEEILRRVEELLDEFRFHDVLHHDRELEESPPFIEGRIDLKVRGRDADTTDG
jgi:two-component sensor histidine kinase